MSNLMYMCTVQKLFYYSVIVIKYFWLLTKSWVIPVFSNYFLTTTFEFILYFLAYNFFFAHSKSLSNLQQTLSVYVLNTIKNKMIGHQGIKKNI